MAGLPISLAIALWFVASCWAVIVVAYLFDQADWLLLPLVVLGACTGAAEWFLRRRR